MTVTVSPGVNAFVGTKFPPRPSECGFSLPAWAWLREPVTVTDPDLARGDPPERDLGVGGATRLPLIGNTLTAGDAAIDEDGPPITPGASATQQPDRPAPPPSPSSANPFSRSLVRAC